VEQIIAEALMVGTHSFLHDPLFATMFRSICRERKIVEFYLCTNPEGMLLLDANGVSTLLLIYTEKELHAQYEIAFDQAAPQALLDQLKRGESLPYFWAYGGHYSGECTNWRDFLYPGRELQGQQWYHYGFVDNPPPFKLDAVMSYNAFLSALDPEGQRRARPSGASGVFSG
jgi:hypothetical protein